MHINKENGKIYVGITKQRVEDRWKLGSTYKGNPHFYAAIQKYGWNGFEHVVFASHLTKEEAFNMEKLLISKLRTKENRYGYNITDGGDVPITHNEYVRRKISEAVKGENHPCYGKHLSEDTKRKISEHTKGRVKAKNAGTQPKKILCIETGIIYPSATEAERNVNVSHSAISLAARGIRNTAAGYHWRYIENANTL